MNQEEKLYFEVLGKQCREAWTIFKNPMYRGALEIAQNLYKDRAHFVYELLQNADDQGATMVRFILSRDSLIFVHNAPRHFTITNPETHEVDQKEGRLGDINSIVSIAFSAKQGRKDNNVRIGKFGIGFKSVFQYTTKPEIYDDGVRFFIEDYILPELIEHDHLQRKPGETLFLFPFNKDNQTVAFDEILSTLKRLTDVKPLLFLNSLSQIDWIAEESNGRYSLITSGVFGSGLDLRYETIKGEEKTEDHYWKFERAIKEGSDLKAVVVYHVNDEKHRIDDNYSSHLYCYLPTADKCPIPAILHAPFQLSNNRENIEVDNEHNTRMIELLSVILSESLEEICQMGEAEENPWIDDNITSFINTQDVIDLFGTSASIDLRKLSESVIAAIRKGRMLWCQQRKSYLNVSEGVLLDAEYLPELYPSEILSELFDENYGWVLTTLKMRHKNDAKIAKELGLERMTNQRILSKITNSFLANREESWLLSWYPKLLEVEKLWEDLLYKEIILTADGTFKAPFIKGQADANIHMPEEDESHINEAKNISFVAPLLLQNEGCKNFFRGIGLTKVSLLTMAESIYLPQALDESKDIVSRLKSIAAFAKIYNESLGEKHRSFLESRSICPILKDGSLAFYILDKVKIHNEINDFFFNGNPDIVFFESSSLEQYLCSKEISEITKMVESSKKTSGPAIQESTFSISAANINRIPQGAQRPAYYNQQNIDYESFVEYSVEGLEYFINRNAIKNPSKASEILLAKIAAIDSCRWCRYKSVNRNREYSLKVEPLFFANLREASWINYASKELRKILGLPVEEIPSDELGRIGELLSSSGVVSSEQVDRLIDYLKEKNVLEGFQLEKEIQEQKERLETIRPFTLDWLNEILSLRKKYVEANKKDDIEILINRLKSAIESIEFDHDADLRSILSENIEVLFGPPGTGKTTYIARRVNKELNNNHDAQVLILTPTHHSSDVVAMKIKNAGCDVLRAVNTTSPCNKELVEQIISQGLEVTNSCNEEGANIIACTVHYFSDPLTHIHDHPWDIIIIDETSMVTLDYVLLVLIKGRENNSKCRFLIAGDPLQLPAITNLDPFILEKADLDEFNFFSFIGLKEFSDDVSKLCEPVRDKIKITLLRKQYRSVKSLALLTGRFAYNDQIEPQRDDRCNMDIPKGALPIFQQPLSFVRFPITEHHWNASEPTPYITDLEKLRGSNYNIYSALIVVEFLRHLFAKYREEGNHTGLKVGIITPYVGQKLLLKEIIEKDGLSRDWGLEVKVNTVHQFQGDEFDVVMLVLNPPNGNMNPANGIMINKFYLMNVAISRAKDCLVVLYPDDSCKAQQNFWHVNKNSDKENLENIATQILGRSVESMTYHSSQLEELMFGEKDYLQKNCKIEYRKDVNMHHDDSAIRYYFYIGGDTIDIITSSDS
mgnify:FL=1